MGLRSMTVERFEQIRRAWPMAVAFARSPERWDTVREARDGLRQSPDVPKRRNDLLWMQQLD